LPIGMIVVKWDNRRGTVLEARFPPSLRVDPDLTMKIYGSHVLGEAREANLISIRVDDLRIISYFGGIEINRYVAILLSEAEDPEDYEEVVVEVASRIFDQIEGGEYLEHLEDLFKLIEQYPHMSIEQKVARLFLDPMKVFVLQKLREKGLMTLDQLSGEIKHAFGLRTVDMRSVLSPLVKLDLVVTRWIEGASSEVAFLVRDCEILRVPPRTKKVPRDIRSSVIALFSKYKPDSREAMVLARALTDPDTYRVLSCIRKKGVVSIEEIRDEVDIPSGELFDILGWLERNRFIEMRGEEVFPLSEPLLLIFFPEYQLRKMIELYGNVESWDEGLRQYLMLLKESYMEMMREKR